MKKFLAVVLAAALCLTFCACGSIFKELKDSAEKALQAESAAPKETETEIKEAAAPKTEKSGVGTKPAKAKTTSADTGKDTEQNPERNTAAESGKTAERAAEKNMPAISAAEYAYHPVRVTKSPTGETVYEGGSASFVAYAENGAGISWLIVNPNGRDFVEASALAKAMPGLAISGTASNTLTIGCIPVSFDGWYVQAKFYGEGGPVHSSMARLTVWPYPAGSAAWDPRACPGGCGPFDPWSCPGSCGTYDPWNPDQSCGAWNYGYTCDPWGCGGFEPWMQGGCPW